MSSYHCRLVTNEPHISYPYRSPGLIFLLVPLKLLTTYTSGRTNTTTKYPCMDLILDCLTCQFYTREIRLIWTYYEKYFNNILRILDQRVLVIRGLPKRTVLLRRKKTVATRGRERFGTHGALLPGRWWRKEVSHSVRNGTRRKISHVGLRLDQEELGRLRGYRGNKRG